MPPAATSERWRPLRSGLINLFKYENEVFQFEDGRLLLRGNNGAGKSRVLALQLPFLLDGEISSHRVEPDGDPAKRMEWNLLMGDKHDNRLGYTWIEFGRVDADGGEHYLTLACGLHARRQGNLNRWYAITPLRIGSELQLVSEQNLPLTKDRLVAAMDGRGRIFDAPREYRVAVDEALFQLGPRYEPLIELLIRLRQPQLSRKLEQQVLSDALSEALAPLSSGLIEDIAAAFRGIEDDREAMGDYRAAQADVAEFLTTYQTYAAIVVRRHSEIVRKENSRYEQSARDKKKYSEEREQLEEDLKVLTADLGQADNHLSARRTAERTLRDSPEMKSVETLELAQSNRDERKQSLDHARDSEKHEEESHERCRVEHDAVKNKFDIRRSEADSALLEFRKTGEKAKLPIAEMPERKVFEKGCQRRDKAIIHLRRLNKELNEADQRHRAAEDELTRTCGELETARESAAGAEETLADSVNDFTRQSLAWEASTTELRLAGETDWRETVLDWLPDRQSRFPFEHAVHAAHSRIQGELIAGRESLSEQKRQRQGELEALDSELNELKSGRQPEPPVPHTRTSDARDGRDGAPFWKLCDFRDDVPAAERSGYEAALEASGILDAWLTPDGSLIDTASGDVFLVASVDTSEGGLNRILSVASDTVQADVVCRVLRRIGCTSGDGATWVAADGRWANGPLRGAWMKAEAEYLGFNAREQARLRKIARLETRQRDLQASLDELERAISKFTARLETLERERSTAPTADAIREAAVLRDACHRAVLDAQVRVNEADQLAASTRKSLEVCRDKRDQDATDLGLTAWREAEALTDLDKLMSRLREAATVYWGAQRAAGEADIALNTVAERLAGIARRLEELRQLRESSERRFSEADAEFKTLRDTHGKTATEIMARLQHTLKEIEEAEKQVKLLRSEHSKTDGDIRVKDEQIKQAEEERTGRQTSRDEAVERLHQLVTSEFIGEADADLRSDSTAWSVARALELARKAEQTLKVTNSDDEALTRAQTLLQAQLTRLHDQLGTHGYPSRAEAVQDGVWIVKCPFQGQDRTMSALHSLLGDEVAHRSRMLDEREREVIENHLIGEVAKELQERIRAGEKWVDDVNSELEQRPTSSGIKLKFVWRVDPEGPPGLAEANQQLLRMAAVWSSAERTAIGDFLQNRIRAERIENEEGTWQDHLARALDYRSWRRFDIERWQDGKWQRLTRRTYGTGSGGEKAMTLTVPQFAAAAAHYRSASKIAPRLILLDEVFVGIDAETCAKLMGLLNAFDLDYVMTSEREWGCYPSVPSLAIYQLASRPELNAVHVTRWVWNGREKVRDR